MERAARAEAIDCQLLVNHRAYGNLSDLGSHLFYEGKLTSSFKTCERFPSSVVHLRDLYLNPMVAPFRLDSPRLIVHVKGASEEQHGTSFYNPAHVNFVFKMVQRLLSDKKFKGKILIISPYREQVVRYRAVMRAFHVERVEVRTVETVQGGEASVVFFDLTRERSTPFNNESHRLAVSLTRAQEAEIIIMHEKQARERAGNFGRMLDFYQNDQHAPIAQVSPTTGRREPGGPHAPKAVPTAAQSAPTTAQGATTIAEGLTGLIDLIDLDDDADDGEYDTMQVGAYMEELAAIGAASADQPERPLDRMFKPLIPDLAPAVRPCVHQNIYVPATEDSAARHAGKQIRKVSEEQQQEIDEDECEAFKVPAMETPRASIAHRELPGRFDLLTDDPGWW